MKVVFCITCKGRAHHIRKTLPLNLKYNPEATFVLLNYNTDDNLLQEVEQDHHQEIASGRLAVYTFMEETKFKMAHAKNMAHRLAISEGGDILVNLDADNVTGPNFDRYLRHQYEVYGKNIFFWSKMVPGKLPRGISGRLVVTADQFINLGGYDERFDTWGHDDKDFTERLIRGGFHPQEIPAIYLLESLRHDDKLRFKDYPEVKPDWDSYEDCKRYEEYIRQINTIVNYGNFGCGPVRRNFVPSDKFSCFILKPIPTRIFGIGMHKTATTSLHEALSLLGYDSEHWRHARWARNVWEEMTQEGFSRTLEQNYAISDFPITILYKELDKAYPNSLFILTVRDSKEWIKSVRDHWDGSKNPWRADWNNDCFTNKMHHLVYGHKNFQEESMLERYHRHNREVIKYFSNSQRAHRLLVMDMSKGGNWDTLCTFLGKPVPLVEYPRSNTTAGGIKENKP